MQKGKNILICPLEWGLGHAGRMVPIAQKLMEMGNNVLVGSGQDHLEFYGKELPGVTCVHFPGFRIRYSGWLPQFLVILLKAPAIIFQAVREHNRLKKIITDYSIDIVISDSRIGLWNKGITTVFVTHMLKAPHPRGFGFLENLWIPVTGIIAAKFARCFIPDLPGEVNISGKLSHGLRLPENARYIGLLSRFTRHFPGSMPVAKKYYCTVILSGPEPQKTILKGKITEMLISAGKPAVILEGSPGGEIQRSETGNITLISHLPSEEMKSLIEESENLVARPGYTTLMELVSINRSALIIPTPGQTEQEYLAEYMSGKGWFKTISQKKISSQTDITELPSRYPEHIIEESEKLLSEALHELLEYQHK